MNLDEGCRRDAHVMQMALELAARGTGRVTPNPLVGAVVVAPDGRVVGRGFHAAAGSPHAEVNALADAGPAARNATLYVTLEPCNHQGRTPPCTRAITAAGIRRVVAAMPDPNPAVAGGGIAALRRQGLAVTVGVCRAAAERLNEAFVTFVTTGRPLVTLKCAMTLDGAIATRSGDAHWVSGPDSRALVHRLRHASDAILVGRGTVASDDPRLTTRLPLGGGCDPVRIVLDSRLAIDETATVLTVSSTAPTIVVAGPDAPAEKRRRLEDRGATVWTVATDEMGIRWEPLLARLAERDITSLLVEGGSRVGGSALRAGVVDKVLLFYAPKLLGADDGAPLARGRGPLQMNQALPVRDVRVRRLGDDVLVEGYLRA